MVQTVSRIAVLATLSMAAASCAIQHNDGLTPTVSSSPSGGYVGTWKSSTASAPTGNTCGNFEWRVTNQAEGIISGIFLAQCGGNLTVSGSAWAQPNGSTIPITATAGATAPGIVACDVSLVSAASVDGDTMRVPYSGNTCLGPISGTELLRRQ
jgi:hypothetical protein